MKQLILPPPLKPGDLVIAIAPSGAVRETQRLEAGLALWKARGYTVELGTHWDNRWGYLAGDDKQRRQSLNQAWQNICSLLLQDPLLQQYKFLS